VRNVGYEAMAPILGLPLNGYYPCPVKPLFLLHEVNLYKVLAALECSCHNHERVRLSIEQPRRLVMNHAVIIPDSKVVLEFYHEPPPNKATMYLESDESSAALPRWIRTKGFLYGEYFRLDPTAQFHVLVIAPHERRRDSLRDAVASFLAEAARKGRIYPPELWCFALRADALHDPLGRIWYGVHEDEPVSMLDL
jgi:hypothetical protein